MLFIDVKKADLVPKCGENVYVQLPKEANVAEDECGKLEYWLYGCRKAGQAWEDHYAGVLSRAGFIRGVASPVIFFHAEKQIWCVVHGDDFTFTGEDEGLDWITKIMQDNYEVKVRGRLGPDTEDLKEIDILGRVLRYENWGISWRADPRHRKMILEYYGFGSDTKGLSKTGDKDDDKSEEELDGEMTVQEATVFRGVAARANYMAADWPQIQFATKEVCRDMARPTWKSHAKMKKLARYLCTCTEAVWQFPWQSDSEANLMTYTDSDWAGCLKTRRSTSGGAMVLGRHCLRTWSTTQPVVAMSAAEAEYYSMVEGATRAIGLKAMLSELGCCVHAVVISTDSSSAKSFASRRGLGKMRHIDVKELWLQEAVCRGKIRLHKVLGTANPADLFTKYLTQEEVRRHLERLCIYLDFRLFEMRKSTFKSPDC